MTQGISAQAQLWTRVCLAGGEEAAPLCLSGTGSADTSISVLGIHFQRGSLSICEQK